MGAGYAKGGGEAESLLSRSPGGPSAALAVSGTTVMAGSPPLPPPPPSSSLETAFVCLEDALHYRDTRWLRDREWLYRIRHSRNWIAAVYIALAGYLAPCIFTQPRDTQSLWAIDSWLALFHWAGLLVLVCDVIMHVRTIGLKQAFNLLWLCAFAGSLLLGLVDTATRQWTSFAWSRTFAPTAIFYLYPKARHCAASSIRLMPTVLPVVALELLSVLIYSCMLVVLFHPDDDQAFTTLEESFIRLYELSTTVNNPDVWLPLYERYYWSALLFISFLVLNLFLLHNVVLAMVWQGFIVNMKRYAARREEWRDESVQRAFEALDTNENGLIGSSDLMNLLQRIRPHYDRPKLEMLYEYICGVGFNDEGAEFVGAAAFYERIIDALNLRVHSYRNPMPQTPLIVDRLLLILHLWNAGFLLWACIMSPEVFYRPRFWFAMLITAFISTAVPLSKLAIQGPRLFWAFSTWHKVEIVSIIFSVLGMCFLLFFTHFDEWSVLHFEMHGPKDWRLRVCVCLLMASRCLDTGHLLRRFSSINHIAALIFRVMPAVFAQFTVIMSLLHVYAYVGMWCWAGLVTPTTNFGGQEAYFMNNFNSYLSSLVTLFNLLIVNNWQVIAEAYANEVTPSELVYLFFMSFNILAVSVVLNVLSAIFINAFIVKSARLQKSAVSTASHIGGGDFNVGASVAMGAGMSMSLSMAPTPVPKSRSFQRERSHPSFLGRLFSIGGGEEKSPLGLTEVEQEQPVPPVSQSRPKSGTFVPSSSQKVDEDRKEIRQSSRGLAYALTRRQSTTEEDVYREEDGGVAARVTLLNALAMGAGGALGLRLETAQVKHGGLSLTTPRVLHQNYAFIAMVQPYVDDKADPRRSVNVASEISSLLNATFHEAILEGLNDVEQDLTAEAAIVKKGEVPECMLDLPAVVSTVSWRGDKCPAVDLSCVIVNFENGVATILYTAGPPPPAG